VEAALAYLLLSNRTNSLLLLAGSAAHSSGKPALRPYNCCKFLSYRLQVRAAYSSGNPALGVGAGNTPAVIDETADIRMAVSSILVSKVG